MKKDCAFQFYVTYGEIRTAGLFMRGTSESVEDTGLITLDEAKELWNKYLPDFKKAMRQNNPAEMCIWTGMNNDGDYHTAYYHLDTRDDLELQGDDIVKISTTKIGEL